MAKKPVRESLVLGGSKNSLRADWRLWREVIVYVLAIAEQGVRTTLDRAGSLQGLGSHLEVATEVVPSLATMGWERRGRMAVQSGRGCSEKLRFMPRP